MELSRDELVDRVTARTKGTAGDPLSRAEVEQVVDATLLELHELGEQDEGDESNGK